MSRKLRVKTGQANDVFFVIRNLSDESITAQMIPSVVPWQAADYFNKTECFCFQQQSLEPQQSKEMLVRFIVSTNLPEEIDSLILSYTIMNTDAESAKKFSSDIKTENINKYVTGTHILNTPMLHKSDNHSS